MATIYRVVDVNGDSLDCEYDNLNDAEQCADMFAGAHVIEVDEDEERAARILPNVTHAQLVQFALDVQEAIQYLAPRSGADAVDSISSSLQANRSIPAYGHTRNGRTADHWHR